jgi:hypothetical protein
MQIVYVVPYSVEDESFNRSNPVYNIVLPVTGGAALATIGPFDLDDEPSAPQALGDSLMYRGDPYPLLGVPIYFDGADAERVVPSVPGGTVLIMMPLGEGDWLIATRYRVGRITAGAVAWTWPVIDLSGDTNCMPCALVKRGESYFMMVKSKPNDGYDQTARAYYSPINITGAVDPGLFATWSSVGLVPDELSEFGLHGYEALLSVMPDFELAMVGDPSSSGDGASMLRRAVLAGPATAIAGGHEVTGYGYGISFGPTNRFMGQFTLSTSEVSGNITDAVRGYAPATYTQSALQALASPGTSPEISGGTAFLYLGDPPPIPAFWTNMRRAAETI